MNLTPTPLRSGEGFKYPQISTHTKLQSKIVTWGGSREWGVGSRNTISESNLVSKLIPRVQSNYPDITAPKACNVNTVAAVNPLTPAIFMPSYSLFALKNLTHLPVLAFQILTVWS